MAASEPGVSSLSRKDNNWRQDLILQLQERNRKQTYCFADLISLHNRLFESANTLRGENIQLTIANETLRRDAASGTPGLSVNADLEARLLKQAEELATLHKRKGEHTQQIVDLNNKLQEMIKELQIKETSLAENIELNANLRLEISKYHSRERELENINQMLKDEHQALQLAFASLEEKLRKAQEENRQLLDRLIKYKTRDAEKVNEENDNFLKKRQAKMQKELEDAARDTRPVSPDRSSLKEGITGLPTAVPTKVSVTFNAHDGEVYAVKWSPDERMLATGGADRKVKLWNISKGASESKGILVGSNAGVMCVDFDSTGTLILGASNDYASRVWTVSDFRLKGQLFPEIEEFIIAIQDQVIATKNYLKYIIKNPDIQDDKCRKCKQFTETIDHITGGCKILAGKEYTERDNTVAKIIHKAILNTNNTKQDYTPYCKYTPTAIIENEEYKLYWDTTIHTDKTINHNRPDFTLMKKKEKKTYLIDIVIPNDANIEQKYKEKIEKYTPLAQKIKRIWKQQKVNTIPIIISTTGITPYTLEIHLTQLKIPTHIHHKIQKATILHTCNITRNFLNDIS
ncbi:PREDICTED: autophagy-related protein 16-1-like [Eufriesea mexicana]|uniref:autophagy-related protein 16-1-like n=1 Tax=Eufriesea mexicana TaxID=516756 RepID=UPI00083BB666|nr:PREDICTED: autophagy-related protein 16-1-like [Eufriesea mexicana]